MPLHHVRRGSGKPLLLVHGLGGSWRSWSPVLDDLAASREVVAVDLPGFGETPPLPGEVTIASLTDSVAEFIDELDLGAVDTVGSSMGARMVLELARRGVGGNCVALAPGGFWSDRELKVFSGSLRASLPLVRALRPALPRLLGNPVGRTALLAQFSARPWALSRDTVLPDLVGLATAPSTGAALDALTRGPKQVGASVGTLPGRAVLGWGRRDLVTAPKQADRATALFPDATLHWFEKCGHFPHWDAPAETVELILKSTI
jgi:pimeloyl-ACP methyl ester carboxylesterase